MDGNINFYRTLPKMELHAHLNGSLSAETMKELMEMKKQSSDLSDFTYNIWEAVIEHGDKRTLEECFQTFSIAHSLTSNPTAVYKATQNVIREFAEDGVLYLELRSTPRAVPEIMSKEQYIKAIINAVKDSKEDIIVKLIISFDRRQGKETAETSLDLAISANQLYPNIIVGIDLSGDPTKGDMSDYFPILEKARSAGFKITVHCAEVPNAEEVKKILEFHPDRLGHCTCVHPQHGGSQELWRKLLGSNIPVELCLTSNVKCGTVENYKNHHFVHFISAKHPIALATDDKGVFATSLSEEYALAAKYYDLSQEQLWQKTLSTIDYAFASEDEKKLLKQRFFNVKDKLLESK